MIADQLFKLYDSLTQLLTLPGGLTLNGPLTAPSISTPVIGGALVSPVYGPAITINAALGNVFRIVITDGVAFAIGAPTNPTSGQEISLNFVNSSGGAAGAGTFNAIYKMASNTLAVIANGSNRTVTFFYNGTNWIQKLYTADVPN